MRADSRAYTSSPAPVIAAVVRTAMTTVRRVRTETRVKRRRARSVVPVGPLVVGVVIVWPVVVPLVVVILPDRCRLWRHDASLVAPAAAPVALSVAPAVALSVALSFLRALLAIAAR